MTEQPPSAPRTEAGRVLVEDEPRLVTGEHLMLRRVLAIEAEAAAIERRATVERIRERVEAPPTGGESPTLVTVGWVVAILDEMAR